MKKIRIEEAVGRILGHDVTQIIPGKFKGPRFRKGHRIRKEDIPEFLKIGKEHVFVIDLEPGIIHEDEAALRLGKAFSGKNLKTTGPSEGKVTFYSNIQGLLNINLHLLNQINLSKNIILSTLHRYTLCNPGMAVGATRIISLTIPEREIKKVERLCKQEGPVLEVLPYKKFNVGAIITGNEIYQGRVKNGFKRSLEKKITFFGSKLVKKIIVPDDIFQISNAILELQRMPVDLILITGGLSVDPDDLTFAGIKRAGAKIIFYGTPVLPGAMFLYALLNGKPILGLPACVFYHKTTMFDLIFPRILVGMSPTRKEIGLLGHGGFCQNCKPCHFPVCPFGKE
ncbi:MAG: molybdopterin-binding protein [Thermodesulfobacteriota bacterium]